jgi:hypothetical protein
LRPAALLRRRIFGVDFSGAVDAGKLIWLAEARPDADGSVELLSCRPASALPGSAADRARCLTALVEFIAAQGDAAFGCDFPFSLPLQLAGGAAWIDYLDVFGRRFADADAFRAACQASAGRELRRATDREARVPFCAYNIRLYRQTFHGIAGVLAPLAVSGRAAVLPMQPATAGRPLLLEICPASFLRRLGLYGKFGPYKGAAASRYAARQRLLDALVDAGLLASPGADLRRTLLDNRGGDALDSAIAAIACLRALHEPGFDRPRTSDEAFEGRVYF